MHRTLIPVGYTFVAALIIANILLQVCTFALVKLAANEAESYVGIFLNTFYVLAILLIILRAFVWQVILRKMELSRVYPFNSTVPVVVLIVGVTYFGETVTAGNIIGSIIIFVGLLLLMIEK